MADARPDTSPVSASATEALLKEARENAGDFTAKHNREHEPWLCADDELPCDQLGAAKLLRSLADRIAALQREREEKDADLEAARKEIERLREEIPATAEEMAHFARSEEAKKTAEARLDHECSEAVLSMTVARLGGLVEGQPTHRGNFIQRIDELREIEAEIATLRAALREKDEALGICDGCSMTRAACLRAHEVLGAIKCCPDCNHDSRAAKARGE